jgi:hypothetical protein
LPLTEIATLFTKAYAANSRITHFNKLSTGLAIENWLAKNKKAPIEFSAKKKTKELSRAPYQTCCDE